MERTSKTGERKTRLQRLPAAAQEEASLAPPLRDRRQAQRPSRGSAIEQAPAHERKRRSVESEPRTRASP
jgi:hypothetical protein